MKCKKNCDKVPITESNMTYSNVLFCPKPKKRNKIEKGRCFFTFEKLQTENFWH